MSVLIIACPVGRFTNGFARAYSFLDDVARVAAREYEPSDADVVRARLRTMGVQEYRFKPDKGPLRNSPS